MSLPQAADDEKGYLEANYGDVEQQNKADYDDVEKQNQVNDATPTAPSLSYDADAEKTSSEDDAEPIAPPQMKNPMMDPSSFPDGGLQAWLTVGGAWCALFVSFGWINCIGVFQDYYQTRALSQYSSSTIAWIPALEASLMFLGGSWVGRLYDNYGPRYLLLVGSFLHVFGLMMASISTEYYQFLLSQGVCSAVGASMVFYPSFNCITTWFFKKRALSFGLAASGSSLGGVIFPIMVHKLIPKVGFPWTMRICAFMILALLTIANIFIRARIPPFPKPVKLMDFVRPLTELRFGLLILSSFLYFFGLFLPFTFIILEAISKGMGADIAVYLVSILNAASVFGRTLPAGLADKYGRFNVLSIAMVTTTVLVLGMWIPASSNAAIITFAALFGFTSGCIVSVIPACVAGLSDVRQIGVRTGTLFTFVAVAVLVGSPIGGQLISKDKGKFVDLQIFSGVIMAAGCVPFIVLRMLLAEWKLKVKI